MSFFHIYSNQLWKVNYSLVKKEKIPEDINNINWFYYGTRLYSSALKTFYIKIPKSTKIFDGCTGKEYFTLEPLNLIELTKDNSDKINSLTKGNKLQSDIISNTKNTVIKTCTEIKEIYPEMNGACFLNVCKNTGLCLSTIILCEDSVNKFLVNKQGYQFKKCIEEDVFLKKVVVEKKISYSEIVIMLDELTPEQVIKKIKKL